MSEAPRPPALRAELDRRFEAVLVIGEHDLESTETRVAVKALRATGLHLAVVARLPVAELAERLAGPVVEAPVPGALLIGDSRRGEVFVVDGARRPPPVGVAADARAAALLAQVRDALAARLTTLGLGTVSVPAPPGVPMAALDVTVAGAPVEAEAIDELLLAHAVGGSAGLVALAEAAAHEAGIRGPRVAVDGARVEVAASDEGDVVRWAFAELWHRGIGPGDVLVVADQLAAARRGLARLLFPSAERATVAAVHAGTVPVRPGIIPLPGDAAGLRLVLEDQQRRRDDGEVPRAAVEPGWAVVVEELDPVRERVREALLTVADGRFGTSGAPLLDHPAARRWVLAAGVYQGDGPQTHLLTAPVAFRLAGDLYEDSRLRRVLDLHAGVVYEEVRGRGEDIESARFASLARPGSAVLRAAARPALPAGPPLSPPATDPVADGGVDRGAAWMRVAATTGGIAAAAVEAVREGGTGPSLDRLAAYVGDPVALPEAAVAVAAARTLADAGFDRLLAEQRAAWATRWEDGDVVVEGDESLQRDVRFALFHLMASVADRGEAAVGARGLSGPSYSGHVFWDADTFVLPYLAATHPAAARAMLEYRLRRLPEAREAARATGRDGVRFPWESARTGRDVTPPSARDRTGRLVPIRTGQLEDHIVAEVAWAAGTYVDWSGDAEFEHGAARQLLVETARYWASRVRVENDGSTHIYGVIGPDEYHEPVDDNAFTNVMARWNLRRAAAEASESVEDGERRRWLDLADALVDGYDADTGVYEQFAGFHRLEPLIVAEVAPRRPIAADLLLGADRVRQAQVLKQADVVMLHHLLPGEVVPGSLEPNLRYYEPRTAHGSSLSPAVHASLFARARDFDKALEALRLAARMDLDDLTGTTAGGLHLATMGGLWQALAFGFGGLRPTTAALHVDPRLPPAWGALEMRVRFRGSRVRVRCERGHLSILADLPVDVSVDGHTYSVGPGAREFERRGTTWEVMA